MEGYFGSKGGASVYQNIINIIPPHRELIIPFLGHCGVTRNILPAATTICYDLSEHVIHSWKKAYAKHPIFRNKYAVQIPKYRDEDPIYFYKANGIKALNKNNDSKDCVIYCDPPYLKYTRKSPTKQYETEADHIYFLQQVVKMEHAHILISTYDNPLYREYLKGWNTISFRAKTRRGMATETVYFNDEKPTQLHDYRYLGDNFKKREHLRLKRACWIERFKSMDELERNYIFNAMLSDLPSLKQMILQEE